MARSTFKNPITRKRIQRFKEMKRAYLSLWILVILYTLSLFSELICNNNPLWIKYSGHFFFPVFKFYPEDTFIPNGRKTHPDYKALAKTPEFQNNNNYMVFPLIPFGPFESIDANTIQIPDHVVLRLTPVPLIGNIDILKNLSILRARGVEPFVHVSDRELTGKSLSDIVQLPETLRQDILNRFKNLESPAAAYPLPRHNSGIDMELYLSTYTPRDLAPKTIRISFRQRLKSSTKSVELSFSRNLELTNPFPAIWEQIETTDQKHLLSLVRQRFNHLVDPIILDSNNRQYQVEFNKEEVRFPFPPVKEHILGIDSAGRDVLARILYGFRTSLTFGLILVFCSTAIGIITGAIQGYYGGMVDITAQRLIEIWSALPFLYIMILMGSVYGRSFVLLLICYGLFNWIGISYYIRAEFLRLRKQPFVEAAQCMGISTRKILFKHILPNAMVPIITFFPFSLVGAIGSLAALDYLGFGLPPPTPSWGELLLQAQQYRWAWWLILYPSLALFIVMLLGVFVGEGVRNAYDPKRFTKLE